MSRLGRAHPSFSYHRIQGAYLTTSISVGDSESISAIDAQSTVSNFSNADSSSVIDLNTKLDPISSEIATFFDTGQILIGVVDSDVHGFLEDQNVGPIGSDSIFSGGSDTNVTISNISTIESSTSIESYSLNNVGIDTLFTIENSSVGIKSNDTISSNFSETQSVLFSSFDIGLSIDQSAINASVIDTQPSSSIENGSIGFSLISGDTVSSIESNNYSSSLASSDQGVSVETYWALGIFLSETISLNDNMKLNFISADSMSSSDNLYVVSISAFDGDTISGSDTSVAIIGSTITLEWDVDMLIGYRVFSVGKLYSRGT